MRYLPCRCPRDQLPLTPEMDAGEDAMLDGRERAPAQQPAQLPAGLAPQMDGLVVYMPETQT